tara:strand:- start:297 stop:956 length:660 start_codon:yes stop_codon:yes gene_type:complete
MKNLFLFAIAITFVSCNSSKWSKEDMQRCSDEIKLGMKSDPDALEVFEAMGEDMDYVSKCICKKLSDEFDSYIEADVKLINISENEAALRMMPCLSEPTQKLMQLGLDYELMQLGEDLSNKSNSLSSSSWSADEMDLCGSAMKVGMLSEPEAVEVFEALGENMEDLSNCLCSKFSVEFSSMEAASSYLLSLSEKEAATQILGCLSENNQKLMQLGLDQM